MNSTFKITHDRDFLQHFLTDWRTKSISPQMVEILKENSKSDPYAAYGYGRWLSLVNPDGNSLKKAEGLLIRAGKHGVVDATAALSRMFYKGRIEADEAMPEMHASLMHHSYNNNSELAQYQAIENMINGEYGFPKDPAHQADVLQKHLDKHPDADPIYYTLLGLALSSIDSEAAEKAFRNSIKRGNTESYYFLALLYSKQGDESKACSVAEEGAKLGEVRCHRYKARMSQEEFLSLSPQQQEILHQEIAEGLDYAIARYDSHACFLKAYSQYYGEIGYPVNYEEALKTLERGCEMGSPDCYSLKAVIHYKNGENLPAEMRASVADIAKTCLQAVRLGDRGIFTLEQVAKGYVSGLLGKHDKEIEKMWLKEFIAANPEEEDTQDALGVISVYPQGFFYAMDIEEETIDSNELAGRIDARSFDVVHYSPILQRITKALCWDKEACHVAMLVDKDGYMKDLPDNMTGTLVYGRGLEIRGTVIFVLEDDKTYSLKPMKGLNQAYNFITMLNAATGDLVRQPTHEELESIGVNDIGGYEDYDDSDIDDDYIDDESEVCRDDAEDKVCRDDEMKEPRELTIPLEQLEDAIKQCNLCVDTLIVTLPDSRDYWFMSSDELIYQLEIKTAIEENIKQHGGYMIDEWQYVDARQVPMDIRSRVRFK